MKKVFIFLVFALISAACGTSNETKNTAVKAPVKEETFTSGADPRADIISSTKKLQKLPFWSAKITSETTPESNVEMEYLAPDRFHIKNLQGEVIVIGTDSYVYQKGKWEKIKDDLGEYIRTFTNSGIQEGIKNLTDVQIIGKEKVDGKDSAIYLCKFGDITTKIWLTDDSGLQVKTDTEATIGGQIEKRTTVYDYDKKVDIEAPKID